MAYIQGSYVGNLRTHLKHEKSGKELITDAPTDNHGKGEAFSPTDLVCAALGSCMATLMGIHARKNDFELPLFDYSIQKYMAADPRRISKIKIDFVFHKNTLNEAQKEILKNAALNCPVALSVHPDLKQEISFQF